MGVACEWCIYLSLFGGFSQHSFIFFFLSTWGVMSLGHVVSSVLDLCVECDIVQLSVNLILGYLFPHSLYNPIIMALCAIIVDLQSCSCGMCKSILLYTCCVLYYVNYCIYSKRIMKVSGKRLTYKFLFDIQKYVIRNQARTISNS